MQILFSYSEYRLLTIVDFCEPNMYVTVSLSSVE